MPSKHKILSFILALRKPGMVGCIGVLTPHSEDRETRIRKKRRGEERGEEEGEVVKRMIKEKAFCPELEMKQ